MKNNRWQRLKKYNFYHRIFLIVPIIILGIIMALMSKFDSIILGIFSLPFIGALGIDFFESSISKSLKNTCFCFFRNDNHYEITQKVTSGKNYVDSKILKDRQSYYKMSAVNLINQLPVYDGSNIPMTYYFLSHAYTVHLFRLLERKHYVKDVVVNKYKNKEDLSRYTKALGFPASQHQHRLYRVNFTLAEDIDSPKVALQLINEVGLNQRHFKVVKDDVTAYLKIRYGNVVMDHILTKSKEMVKVLTHKRR